MRETNLYIGTNTQGTGSKGIYLLQIDDQGILTLKEGHAHTENPSFLVAAEQGQLLHACSEPAIKAEPFCMRAWVHRYRPVDV